MEIIEKTLEANIENLHDVLGFIEEHFEAHQASMKATNVTCISVEEIYANICMYAYGEENTKEKCTIKLWFDDNSAFISFEDTGMEFNPLEKEDPDISASAEERGIGGLGIFMVKKYMDECTYERVDGKNILTLRKVIK